MMLGSGLAVAGAQVGVEGFPARCGDHACEDGPGARIQHAFIAMVLGALRESFPGGHGGSVWMMRSSMTIGTAAIPRSR